MSNKELFKCIIILRRQVNACGSIASTMQRITACENQLKEKGYKADLLHINEGTLNRVFENENLINQYKL